MSGGSQHNPNGRQSQLGSGWSPSLQLQMAASYLGRAPQAHLSSERGVSWHTPTPPPHLYHVPAPSPPDPLQGLLQLQTMKVGGGVFRHSATPPDLYRHTPTPPDKHARRHTPSPGDVKAELYPHIGPGRDKLRPEELVAYARGVTSAVPSGVDLSVTSRANGAPHPPHPSPALSVRDAPTINSLIARAQPRHGQARVDALLEKLVPSPVSPHSVIVHPRAPVTPSPPDSNEDSADSCGAPPGSKRKRKPERTIRVPTVTAPPPSPPRPPLPNGDLHTEPTVPTTPTTTPTTINTITPVVNPPPPQAEPEKPDPTPPTRRKSRSPSAETIDDIAAMVAAEQPASVTPEPEPVTTIDKLEDVLASPEKGEVSAPEDKGKATESKEESKESEETKAASPAASAAAPRCASPAPAESPTEAGSAAETGAEPTATSFVEVENQLEKMFAGIEEEPPQDKLPKPRKRRKSAPAKGEGKRSRRRASVDETRRRKKPAARPPKKDAPKDAYDSGSNASSSRSRGPYLKIRGPRASPASVSVINAEEESSRREEFRNGARARVRGLHASTLGLRYDATTADASWLCAFCQLGPHAQQLGDLFGPYTLDTDCEEYRSLDEGTRRRYSSEPAEVWLHAACGVWAPGLVGAGARLWGLRGAVWAARGARCGCGRAGAALACGARACRARAHLPCARAAHWTLRPDAFRAHCPRHAPDGEQDK